MTVLQRLLLSTFLFLVWAPAAHAWSWPVQGPVLQAFNYDEAHPYAAGQHRGIDIGADAAAETVVAPAAGTVSFAGTVPTSGQSVTIQTADGYSVTLTHLGSILVAKGATIAEADAVGTIGPSGTPEFERPYLHLGIRVSTDPNGYRDPLQFLPPPSASAPAPGESAGSQPGTSGAGVPAEPSASSSGASSTPSTAGAQGAPQARQNDAARGYGRERRTRPRSAGRTADARPASEGRDAERQQSARHRPVHRPAGGGLNESRQVHTTRRPDVKTRSQAQDRQSPAAATPDQAGRRVHIQPAPSSQAVALERPRRTAPVPLLPLVLNGLAALVALTAALAAGRRRRRMPSDAQVVRLPRPRFGQVERHAA
jgi:hypothetical protein